MKFNSDINKDKMLYYANKELNQIKAAYFIHHLYIII